MSFSAVDTHINLDELIANLTLDQLASDMNDQERRRIGILGGTFNPPHLGHLLMAEQVGNQLELDEIWFMPTAKPPHKPGKKTIQSQHRLAMLDLAIANNSLFKIQPYEINRGGINYTIDTMRHFTQNFPESDFYFIIGGDSANDLDLWREADALTQLVQFVGVRRPGQPPYTGKYPILWVDSPLVDISSTEIRLRVFLEQSIRYQVPHEVEQYIETHQLYRQI